MNTFLYACYCAVLLAVMFGTVRWINKVSGEGTVEQTPEQFHGGVAAGIILLPLEFLIITVIFFWLFPSL